jgi:alginate O-acetyltransferase complex protein AlgI
VLFNTLAYAKFFGIVLVVSWMLVSRRWVLLLPWFGLAGYAAFSPLSPSAAGIAIVAFVLTGMLCRMDDAHELPRVRLALASVVVNLGGLAFLTYRHARVDPLTLGLRALRVPVGTTPLWTVLSLVAAAALVTLLVRARRVRLLFLLGASYVFYAHWDWRFLPLIWGSSTIDWLLGNAIGRARDRRARKVWLVGTVVVNLGILGVFKYFNFGVDTATALLRTAGIEAPSIVLRVALPVGISFFTFESMSYVIDIYRGTIQPHKSYAEYLSFVAFFPHLVAGPIIRPRDLLPQLANAARFSGEEGSEALFLIATGLLKKVAIGDYLALNLVDRVFDAPAQYSALECYTGVVGYAVQIYTDFSGYTDIAIGSALLLGVRFPLNFNSPYKAPNISDFWHRWHISLSSWLRDYLYISLGGNRHGSLRTYVNLMLTMLLGGLWHGASWTFVVWGGLHGGALGVTRWYERLRKRLGRAPSTSRLVHALCVVATFHFVLVTWVFFRSETFGQAWIMFSELATLTTHHANLHPMVLAVLGVGLGSHFVPDRWYLASQRAFARLPAPAQGIALFCAALTLRQMTSAETVPFVYFQF